RAGEGTAGDCGCRVGLRCTTSRYTGSRAVPAAPRGQLRQVVVIASVSHSSLGHKVFQTLEFVDSAQSYPRARCPRAHQSEVALGYRPRAVVAAIGAAPWDRCREDDVDLIGRVPIKLDRGQAVAFVRIRQPMNL